MCSVFDCNGLDRADSLACAATNATIPIDDSDVQRIDTRLMLNFIDPPV